MVRAVQANPYKILINNLNTGGVGWIGRALLLPTQCGSFVSYQKNGNCCFEMRLFPLLIFLMPLYAFRANWPRNVLTNPFPPSLLRGSGHLPFTALLILCFFFISVLPKFSVTITPDINDVVTNPTVRYTICAT